MALPNDIGRFAANVSGTLFFTANDGSDGYQLWKTDGFSSGTTMVEDFFPGSTGIVPDHLTNVGGTLFFTASDGSHGVQVWRSNGTSANTYMVKYVPGHGISGSYPSYLTNVNGTLFFSAQTSVGTELYRSNGTPATTYLVKDINPGPGSSSPFDLTNFNGTLFFGADDGHGSALWKSNGTSSGTVLVSDVRPGVFKNTPYFVFTNSNGTLFFEGNDGSHGVELWRTDGSSSGTFMVKDINPNAGSSLPMSLARSLGTNFNGTFFFEGNDGSHGYQLWQSNGTSSGTSLVKDVNMYPGYLTNFQGTLFFSANDGSHGYELWQSDGTSSGTSMVADLNPDAASSGSVPIGVVNGMLLLNATNGSTGFEPWTLGTTTGTVTASADLSVSKSANVTAVTAGGTVTYTVILTNTGPDAASGVQLTDTLPAGMTFQSDSIPTNPAGFFASNTGSTVTFVAEGSVASGSSDVFLIVASADATLTASTTLTDTAAITADSTPDPNSSNNSATFATTITSTGTTTASADLTIAKTANVTAIPPGGTVTYTITLTNSGPDAANGVQLTDVVPAGLTVQSEGFVTNPAGFGASASGGTVTFIADSSVASGTSDVLTIVATADATLTAGLVLSDTVTIAADATPDPNPTITASFATTITTSGGGGGGGGSAAVAAASPPQASSVPLNFLPFFLEGFFLEEYLLTGQQSWLGLAAIEAIPLVNNPLDGTLPADLYFAFGVGVAKAQNKGTG